MSRPTRTTDLQTEIYEELKKGDQKTLELCAKFGLTYEQLVRQMDSLGILYPVYNPYPGTWAILKGEDYGRM